MRSQNNALSDLAEHGVILNNAPTNDLDRTYKLFFNNPTDPEVLAALGIATPDGENAISNFTFTGNPSPNPAAPELKANEGFVGEGGTFSFDVGDVAATSYEITLSFGDNNTVTLSNTLVKNGTNTIAWDGLDANGVKVPAGTYDLNNVAIKLKGRRGALPLLDVENNYDGVRSTAWEPTARRGLHRVLQQQLLERRRRHAAVEHVELGRGRHAGPQRDEAWTRTPRARWPIRTARAPDGARHLGLPDTPIVLQNFQFKLMDVPTELTVHKTWDHGANHADRCPPPSTWALGRRHGHRHADAHRADGRRRRRRYLHLDRPRPEPKSYTVREANVPEGYQPSEAIAGDSRLVHQADEHLHPAT